MTRADASNANGSSATLVVFIKNTSRMIMTCLMLILAGLSLNASRTAMDSMLLSSFDRDSIALLPTLFLDPHHQQQQQNLSAVHVLMSLSGIHSGLFLEFEMSLKSVLMNAPESLSMTIHIMADTAAFRGLDEVFARSEIEQWTSITPISIRTYHCADDGEQQKRWKRRVKKLYGRYHGLFNHFLRRHTIGAWFRLFAHEVLPPDVHEFLYLDTDVIVMANLQGLWNHIIHHQANSTTASLYWGKSRCSGFVVLNAAQIPAMWKVVEHPYHADMKKLRREHNIAMDEGDQSFLAVFQHLQPDSVVTLPDAWDNHLAASATGNATTGLWKMKKNLQDERPEIGYLHFNGGGAGKNAWFLDSNHDGNDTTKYSWWISDQSPEFPELHETFGIADYYIRIPWGWARCFASSKIAVGQQAHRLTLDHRRRHLPTEN